MILFENLVSQTPVYHHFPYFNMFQQPFWVVAFSASAMLCGAKVHCTAHPATHPGRSGSLHALPQGPQPSRRAWLALVAAAGGWVPRVARAAKRLKENSDLGKVTGIGMGRVSPKTCFEMF